MEALALKAATSREPVELAWVSGDWNLADNFTKVKPACREGVRAFMLSRRWRIKFDPEFVVAEKKTTVKAPQPLRELIQRGADLEQYHNDTEDQDGNEQYHNDTEDQDGKEQYHNDTEDQGGNEQYHNDTEDQDGNEQDHDLSSSELVWKKG